MRRLVLALAALATLGLAVATPTRAITNGSPTATGTRTSAAWWPPRRTRTARGSTAPDVDLADGLPDRRPCGEGEPRAGHLRLGLPGRRHGLRRHLPRRPALQPARRATRTTSPSWCSTSRSRASRRPAARRRLAVELPAAQPFTSVGYGAYEVTNRRAATSTSTTTCAASPPEPSTRSTRRGCGSR